MTLANTADLMAAAQVRGRGLFAFNFITLEHIEAIIAGAELGSSPIILQLSQNAVRFHGNQLHPVVAAASEAAAAATVEISLHLDHVEDMALLEQAPECGFSSAMFDAAGLPYEQNVAATRAAADWAHGVGLWLEAELGYVGGKPGAVSDAHAAGVRTDPDEAAEFVRRTSVDSLAVAVGSSHAMTSRTARLDHDLIARIRHRVDVPLVLHGSSGVGEHDLVLGVAAGIVKINVGTALNVAYTDAIRVALAQDDALVDPRRYLSRARDRMSETVRQLTSLSERDPSAAPNSSMVAD